LTSQPIRLQWVCSGCGGGPSSRRVR
jgi:hypothetical protein